MTHWRNVLAAAAIGGGGAYIAWRHSTDDIANAAQEIVELKLHDSRMIAEFEGAMREAVAGTRFADAAALNPSSNGRGLKIHLFDSANPRISQAAALPLIRKNCASLAATEIIVCDVATVDDLVAHLSPAIEERSAVRRAVVLWLLAHEVGHIIHGHSGAHQFHDGVEQGVNPGSVDHREELEADEFASSVLFRDSKARIVVVQALISLINIEVRDKGIQPQYGVGILFDYNSIVKVTSRCSHPEMVIRAVRLLHIYGHQANDLAIQAMLDPFVRTLRDSAGMCGAAA
jgi:hypothetical protein